MSLSYTFLLFIIYSFMGWAWETTFCSIKAKRFINRGFLYGPLCPVYGFGGMLVLYFLAPLSKTWIPLFIGAMIITSLLEYFTSWLLETLFHTKWWDYSKRKFNLHGRIFLGGALCFGLMATLVSHYVHPFLVQFLLSIPLKVAQAVAWIIFAIFLVDLIFTVKHLIHFTVHMSRLKDFMDYLKDRFSEESWFSEHAHSLSELFDVIKEKAHQKKIQISENLLEKIDHFSSHQQKLTRMAKKYPAMYSSKFKAGVENLHARAKEDSKRKS